MKAKELRIGNWLNGYKMIGGWKPFRMSANMINQLDEKEWERNPSLPDITKNIKPIPLTVQWLKDFKFKENWATWHISISRKGTTLKVSLDNDYFIQIGTTNTEKLNKIKYVHQLQNLYFALTGKELIKQEDKTTN